MRDDCVSFCQAVGSVNRYSELLEGDASTRESVNLQELTVFLLPSNSRVCECVVLQEPFCLPFCICSHGVDGVFEPVCSYCIGRIDLLDEMDPGA